MKFRKVAALAALANRDYYAGKSPKHASLMTDSLLEGMRADKNIVSTMSGGLMVRRTEDSLQLFLYLGDLGSDDD